MPSPINSIRVRVVKARDGYYAQFTVGGLIWHNVDGIPKEEFGAAKYVAMRLYLDANALPAAGDVVWTSSE
jgi:hypothetical protein